MALPEIQRKVRQYGADIDSIWEILTGHGEDLDQIKSTQDNHGTSLRKIQATQLQQGSRLDQIEDRLTGLDTKLAEVLALLRQLTKGSTPQP